MKNKKAQMEFSPLGIIMAFIAAVMGFFIAKSMNPGIFWLTLTVLVCAGAGYFISLKLGDA